MEKERSIKVVELFAGVGGFRLGLENSSSRFETVWANQWEPGRAKQYAFDCYVEHFGDSGKHVNEDIAKVKASIPEHDLLVGGFPCQDYSVARTGAKGIEGKKGVLWWEINSIVERNRPKYVLLENVDRLLRSPANQRGRDFGVILRCFDDLGYAVEWRVINAAEYGNAQRRRRVFIFAYKKSTDLYSSAINQIRINNKYDFRNWVLNNSFFATVFPVKKDSITKNTSTGRVGRDKYDDLALLSREFSKHFFNSGMMINGCFYSEKVEPISIQPKRLRDVRHEECVDERFFINGSTEKWEYLKGAKKIERKRPNGETYYYSEGGMCFPDNLDLPARTMLTSESSVNRSTHVIKDFNTDRLRLLTPVECERLNGFPDDWTNTGMPEKFRYFVMGNALVVPLITKIGKKILELFQ